MAQTLNELLIKKKIVNSAAKVKEFLVGKKIKVVGNRSNHNIAIGTSVTMDSPAMITNQYYQHNGYNIYFYDAVLTSCDTKEEIDESIKIAEKSIKELQEEIAELDAKKRFMAENKLEVFDEGQFKVYQILQTLKTKKSDIEKAKVIATLVKD